MTELTIENANRKRKWGWGYNLFSNNDSTIDPPTVPAYTGTFNQVEAAKDDDPTFKAHQNIHKSTAWFYQGRRITHNYHYGLLKPAEDIPFSGDYDQYEEWERKNSEHHFNNDQWGYGWFRGFCRDTFMMEKELKIRVA